MSLSTVNTVSQRKIRASLPGFSASLQGDEQALFRAFVDATLPRLRGPFMAQYPPHQILELLQQAFEFARHRASDELKVKLVERTRGLAVFTTMKDQPFIVDTVRLFLRRHKAEYQGGFNLVFNATRDAEGNLVSFGDEGEVESIVMLQADHGKLHDLEQCTSVLRGQLEAAQATVADFRGMVRAIERTVEKLEVLADRTPSSAPASRETADFLKWLLRENFVFMGLDAGETGLGLQSYQGPYAHPAGDDWPQPHSSGRVHVRKSQIESPVHRSGRIDEILVCVDPEDPSQNLYVRGLFTYRAVTQPSRHVPILRRVLAEVLEKQDTEPGSYRYKGLANVFDSLPTELLFTANVESINQMVDLVFQTEQVSEVGVTFVPTGHAGAFCVVSMPKNQYSDELAREVEQTIVSQLKSTYSDFGIFVGRYDTVLLHYYVTGAKQPSDKALSALSETIREMALPWHAHLWQALAESCEDEVQADRLADTYGNAFPEAFRRRTTPSQAVHDILMLNGLSAAKHVRASLFEQNDELVLRLYQVDDIFLTRILPVLDNFGLVVRESWATEVNSRGGKLFIDSFVLEPTPSVPASVLLERRELLEKAIEAIFGAQVEDDPLNQLVLTAGLAWRQVDVIRGYTEYSRQLTVKLSANRLIEIIQKNPKMSRVLVEYFEARFDPDLEGNRKKAMSRAADKVDKQLRRILSHDEDLVFSTLFELMRGSLRTNHYRRDRPFHFLSFKIDCAQVDSMGPVRPVYEIYVHHREVEGVHLRFGPVARGGLRWSDRDDYRTEVLGLVTTQLVKNVVIVPTGSKGGFYLKHPEPDRGARRQQADRLYKTFIRGLLELTDNTVEGEVVKPPRVVCHDGDDPYLVVAADKGTAHLSDTANGISASFGFWLDDAFASGGSVGYDHKGVGITARGAWVLARRHFAEMGIDPYAQDFTCVGIGDMGGDVFGNGLIESKHTRLLAAFNHLHIFLDPDPDAASSWQERQRLFDEVKGWDAYDTSKISKGGGVFDRRAKAIPLSAEAQEMLGIQAEEADPNLVIHRILQMKVDLLWNGGIGTYVKASNETHAHADDRSNDAVRIDATQLRARVVGEGGNLGFTQKGRIEANRLGVRLNTDAIDNSGGVDLSDHEVNLKILLGQVVRRGELTQSQRNELLAELTDEVADLVLVNNDIHGRQLSRDQIRSQNDIFSFGRAIAFVERHFPVKRKQLNLPTDAQLAERATRGEGLSRPELAVLSAWVKMYVYEQLLAGDPKAIPGFERMLFEYFPAAVRERYASDITGHMLANEIAMTVATTRMVGDAGAAFFPMLLETTGASVTEISTAYLKAQQIARIDDVRATLEELRTSVSLNSLYRSWVMVDEGARGVASYWLSAQGRIPTDTEIDQMKEAAQQVYELQASEVAARNASLLEELKSADIPDPVARLILKAQYLNITLMIWAESKRTGLAFPRMVVQHLAVARASRLQRILENLSGRPASGQWEPIALGILHHRFHQLLRTLVARTPIDEGVDQVDDLVPQLANGFLKDVREQVDEMLGDDSPSVATLLVLEERVASAITRLAT